MLNPLKYNFFITVSLKTKVEKLYWIRMENDIIMPKYGPDPQNIAILQSQEKEEF